MQSKAACEEFERKMWQYVDECLTKDEMLYWKEHLGGCARCSSLLVETEDALSLYESIPMEDIEEETFTRMINKAVKKKKTGIIISKLLDPLYEFQPDRFIKRFALGGMAFAAVLVLLFTIYKPGDVIPPEVKMYQSVQTESSPSISQAIVSEKEPLREVKKTEVAPVKYEWRDKSSAHVIRHVAGSIARIRMKKTEYRTLDDWTLQAIALKRKMDWLKRDIDKSVM